MNHSIASCLIPNSLAQHLGTEFFEIAFVTRDMEKSIQYLKENLGASKVFRTQASYPNNKYMGRLVQNQLDFALVWIGNMFIEVIQPSPGDNPFDAYLTDPDRLMNFHHFAIQVSDWDKTVEDIHKAGYEFCFEGSGKAKFGFIDLTKEMGCMLEVIANGEEFFEKIKKGDY